MLTETQDVSKHHELVSEIVDGMDEHSKRALKSWYLYDWANQAFSLTVVTVLVPQLLSSMFELSTGGGSEIGSLKITGDTFYAIILGMAKKKTFDFKCPQKSFLSTTTKIAIVTRTY